MVTTARKRASTNSVKTVAAKASQPRDAATPAPKAASKATAKPEARKSASVAKARLMPSVRPKAEKPVKPKKPKLVRDSFTIPKAEYTVLDELKQRAGKLASPAKKSELIRAGVKALAAMTDIAFLAALKAVPAIKTGRPAKA